MCEYSTLDLIWAKKDWVSFGHRSSNYHNRMHGTMTYWDMVCTQICRIFMLCQIWQISHGRDLNLSCTAIISQRYNIINTTASLPNINSISASACHQQILGILESYPFCLFFLCVWFSLAQSVRSRNMNLFNWLYWSSAFESDLELSVRRLHILWGCELLELGLCQM